MRRVIALLGVVVTSWVCLAAGPVVVAGAQADAAPPTHAYTVVRSSVDEGLVCALARIDLATGAVEELPEPPSRQACAGDLAFAPDGTLYGLVQANSAEFGTAPAELVVFDTASGAVRLVGSIGSFFALGGMSPDGPFGGIAFDATGSLLVMVGALGDVGADPECVTAGVFLTSCLYRIDDPDDPAAVTFLGETARLPSPEPGVVGSTLASACDALYSTPRTAEFPDEEAVFGALLATVSADDGARTDIGSFGAGVLGFGADVDGAGTLWSIVRDGPADGPGARLVVATLDRHGGDDVATLGAVVSDDLEALSVQGLAIEPLDCTPEPEPIVLEPTFTG